jgi:glucose/arabinose dehydrogenase
LGVCDFAHKRLAYHGLTLSRKGGYAATSTGIVRGRASSRNGSFTVRMPFL